MSEVADEYATLTTGVGFVDLSDRTQLELSGDDRATFLHNFSTNDIRGLSPGQGCEAFVLDVRGHTIGHLFVFCTPNSLVLDAVPAQGERLARHFDRYLIREHVEIYDRTADWGELLLAGQEAESLLAQLEAPPPAGRLDHQQVRLAGQFVWLRRTDELAGRGSFLIAGAAESIDALSLSLEAEGAVACHRGLFETLRIEAGFPLFGIDFNEKNLPQEINRNRLAINFNKGCYLGQETVARIDALGHVNKTLQYVRFSGSAVPPAGTELRRDGETVGNVTSAAFSPRTNAPIALAFVRRGQEAVGTVFDSDFGQAEIIALPVTPD